MDTYAKLLVYALPVFGFLIVLEAIIAYFLKLDINNTADMISSLCSGVTNTLKKLLELSIVVFTYKWIEESIGIFNIESSVLLYILAFIGIDFASYWAHRLNHRVNIFWSLHMIHHSSEEFNLSCAFRQEILDIIGIYFLFYLPMAIIGIPVEIISVVAPIHLFVQFWYHTRVINKMGFLEKIIVTPSHHRVHHAKNDIYIDKNYASIFIIWDKLFGTFQEELNDEKPVYGTLKPANTWNPVVINLTHFIQLVKDFWLTKSFKDKIRIWFMPTGWRPADVQIKYPLPEYPLIKKYQPKITPGIKIWSWIQYGIINLMVYYLLTHFHQLNLAEIVAYTTYIFIAVGAITTFLDVHPFAVHLEIAKALISFYFIWNYHAWFSIQTFLPGGLILFQIYLVFSILSAVYFIYFDKKTSPDKSLVYGNFKA